jgi:pimeloyl-ACP methyl ester carboxylesterase
VTSTDDVRAPEQIRIPVEGGDLAALYWAADAPAAPLVVLLHGLTSDAAVWAPLAAELAGGCEVVAPDLRGRGHSAGLPAPYGLSAHAADVTALLERFGADGQAGADATVLVGHSLGGFVAALIAADSPELVHGLVLVDGGLPLAVPPAADTDAMLAAFLGTSLDELGDDVVLEAVRVDGADMLRNEVLLEATTGLAVPTTLLWATRGMQGEAPGLYDEVRLAGLGVGSAVADPHVVAREVPGTDHWSVLSSPAGVTAISAAVRTAGAGAV